MKVGLDEIICKLDNPLVESHHDVIVCTIPISRVNVPQTESVPTAPRVPNNRVKIIWDDTNTPLYQSLLSNNLSPIRERWAEESSLTCFSLLLSSTNDALMSAATTSNKFVKLGVAKVAKPVKYPEVEAAQSASNSCLQNIITNSKATPDAIVCAISGILMPSPQI